MAHCWDKTRNFANYMLEELHVTVLFQPTNEKKICIWMWICSVKMLYVLTYQQISLKYVLSLKLLWIIKKLPDVQADFRKGRGTRDQIATSAGSLKKQESSRIISISALLTMPKPLTVWITINCGKFWKRWEYQTTWPASWETCIQVRKQQLELDMEQQTGSK